jgi:hypothetical protein
VCHTSKLDHPSGLHRPTASLVRSVAVWTPEAKKRLRLDPTRPGLTTRADDGEKNLNGGYHRRKHPEILYAPGGRGGAGWVNKSVGFIDVVDDKP